MTDTPTLGPRPPLDETGLDLLFRNARSYNRWLPVPISDDDIRKIYELAKLGPTSTNSNPARFIWARSSDAKEKLAACVMEPNKPKVLGASVVVIIGFDTEFHRNFDYLMNFAPDKYRSYYESSAQLRYDTAFRNSSLQGAYLMMAARSLGYDCGPMSGFDHAAMNAAFFAGTSVQTNFLCCIGQGSQELLMPRNPRYAFEQVNQIV